MAAMVIFCRKIHEGDMIPIQPKPEPSNFTANVRSPGNQFLFRVPNPNTDQWGKNDYWRRCIFDLYREYQEICAYTGIWIPISAATIDHFVPKSIDPRQAYEWGNYRLSSGRANNKKGTNSGILDPFSIQYDWFLLEFPSLLVKPNHSASQLDAITYTIKTLKLNEEYFIKDRQHWLNEYCRNLDLVFLKTHAPFIAYELKRQKLEDDIIEMMRVRLHDV